jgi:glycosyltransferase involved in cell wall biosynthesis
LEFEQTAELYRSCHAGFVMMFTRHPSYLPFELMASGSLVITNENPATAWFLKDGENCWLSLPSATCFADTLERALTDEAGRQRITAQALEQIRRSHSNWDIEMEKIYHYMCNPAKAAHPRAL